jgi:hypothetical protein
MFPAFPILAIDPGAIVGLIVLVLSVLGWLVNLIKGEDNVPKARPRQGNAAGKDLRSEIQDFLDELTVTRNPDRPNRRPPSEEEVLILEEDQPVRKPVRPAKPEKPRRKEKTATAKTPPAPAPRSISQVQQQHLPTSRLGSGVQDHIATHMAAGQVTSQAQAFIGHRVEQAVQQDLGAASLATGAVPGLSVAKLHPALTFLTRPGSIRDAIVVSEILQPPKALRNRAD